MNNRVFLVLIIVLSCALLLVGAGLIGGALYLQGRPGRTSPAAQDFATPGASDTLLTPIAQNGGPQVGALAPDFTVTGLDGLPVSLADLRGKAVMINFWATWCGPCVAEMKNIEAVYQKHKDAKFMILAVNRGEYTDQVKGYKDLWKLNFPFMMDDSGNAARAYRIQALPTTVFVDGEGKVYEIHIGGPMTVEFIEERVQTLLEKIK